MLYIRKVSYKKKKIEYALLSKYQMLDSKVYDFDAIVSRFFYVKDREDAFWFMLIASECVFTRTKLVQFCFSFLLYLYPSYMNHVY